MQNESSSAWFVYILLCKDGSLYTGITKDVEKRFTAHQTGKGAKYTKLKGVKKILYYFGFPDRRTASIREREIKKLPRGKKIELYSSKI